MSNKDFSNIFNKFSESPWSPVLGLTLVVMTVLGSHFATVDELDLIKNDVQAVRSELTPLQVRVATLEREVVSLSEKTASHEFKLQKMLEDYHKIDISLERMSGRQDITNERLESIREVIDRRDRESGGR